MDELKKKNNKTVHNNKRSNLQPIKSLGQNFLKDANIAKKIVRLLGDIQGKTVYEIGPGMGALTAHLVAANANVTCFDIDSRAIEFLRNNFANSLNVKIIHADIREINVTKECQYPTTIIGNIPYNITNDILFWLLDNSQHIDMAVFTIQREVAERYTAKVGTKQYGITTLALQLYCTAKICFHVSPGAFFPSPKVQSSVILFDFVNKNLHENVNKKDVLLLIRAAFSQRRKVLSNSLKSYFVLKNIELGALKHKLETNNKYYLSQRAEQLTLANYIELYGLIFGYML